MILLERVRKARRARDKAEAAFVKALRTARARHSWAELADAAEMSRNGVRYIVMEDLVREKGESDD